MQSGAMALLRNAARYRERWVKNFYLIRALLHKS
jgi:hypothetical protein